MTMRRGRSTARSAVLTTFVLAALLTFASVAQAATIVPVTKDNAGALLLAQAMATDTSLVTGASFQTVPPFNNPNGVSDTLNDFPTHGANFSILTSGEVTLADDANSSGSTGADDGGGNVRGNSDLDVTILKVDLSVPSGANCLQIDFKFFSDEFPEFVGSGFNDAFIAELDVSNWTTSGSAISAPNNFAFDPSGNVISINAAGTTSMSLGEATNTTYDGATPLLTAAKQVTAGAHSLYLSIFDQGDRVYDSAVFLDNLIIGFVPDPEDNCVSGAQVKAFSMALDPATDTNPVGSSHTVTATLEDETGAPVDGATIQFNVSGANTTTGTGVTDASGQATFTYTGAASGDDTITACYDADSPPDGTCEALATAKKTWEGGDTTGPLCQLTAKSSTGIEVTVQDTGSGLGSIVVTKAVNANVTWPSFTVGTTSQVVVTAAKINTSQKAQVALKITDVAGNVTNCDPVWVVSIRDSGKPESVTYEEIPGVEDTVTVTNGSPGLKNLDVAVNGQLFKVAGLKDGEERSIDISSALHEGEDNVITLTAKGQPGSSADVMIWDGGS